EVFTKSVGDTTDVVQKEMYTFLDKGGRSITLRPELTAGVVRSVIEHGLLAGPMPLKVCYIGGCYRYEKPQAGRLREFHQFGIECFGAQSPAADAEVIMLADTLLRSLGLKSYSLHINSIGCPECRKNYHAALKEYFKSKSDSLCKTCIERLDRNPMRILDCKCPECAAVAANAPVVLDYLCDECKEHFEGVKAHLSAAEIEFSVDPQIVRGLDYYTKTVFEFVSTSLGAQATVCGGGRYDGLVEQMQGPATPALGFGMGIERLLMIMEAENAAIPETATADVYIAPMGSAAALKASALCRKLRDEGFIALTDITGRGLKAQMKYADKVGAAFTVVLGDDELENGKAKIKNMKTGEQCEFSLDSICDTVYKLKENNILDGIFDAKI
ncbi:MAG: histidine--tRNA ligase, partial [Clostridia bacterium]|nr:histidine--tRNA ligase [Clostridia bacterium]